MSQRTQQEGIALIFAILLLAVLSVGAAAFWHQLHDRLDASNHSERDGKLYYWAEAGLEKATVMLRDAPGNYAGEKNTPIGLGQFSVEVQRLPSSGDYRLVSTSKTARRQLTLTRTVAIDTSP